MVCGRPFLCAFRAPPRCRYAMLQATPSATRAPVIGDSMLKNTTLSSWDLRCEWRKPGGGHTQVSVHGHRRRQRHWRYRCGCHFSGFVGEQGSNVLAPQRCGLTSARAKRSKHAHAVLTPVSIGNFFGPTGATAVANALKLNETITTVWVGGAWKAPDPQPVLFVCVRVWREATPTRFPVRG